MLAGLQLIYSTNALAETKERLFPESRHRSLRIRKKLIRRFGGEFRRVPAMWRFGDRIIAHPSFRAEIERQVSQSTGDG